MNHHLEEVKLFMLFIYLLRYHRHSLIGTEAFPHSGSTIAMALILIIIAIQRTNPCILANASVA